MAKKTAGAPQESVLLYDKLVATNAHVQRKGATVPYTAANGNMFSYLSKSGEMALRLPAAEREAFLKKYKTRLCDAYGVVQPEYVMVPPSLLAKTQELEPFFNLSHKYASSHKPKASAKKGAAKA